MVDPDSGRVTTFAGTGVAGHADGAGDRAQFYEPGGLSIANGKLFVADTNNHTLRTVDLSSRQVATLTIDGLTPPDTWSYLRRR
jgi:hypothetical protein